MNSAQIIADVLGDRAPVLSTCDCRIYVACLAAYNNGKLHGVWIDVDELTDADGIQKQVATMLAASPEPDAEEWAIHDHEGLGNISESESWEDICAIAALVHEHGEIVTELLDGHAQDADEAKRMMEENYEGEHKSLEEWAYDFHEQCGTLPDGPLANYVDFAAIGRDAELGGDIFTIDAGGGAVHVFSNH